jgi:16S rRNA (guanine527-N7)-methyltransferase
MLAPDLRRRLTVQLEDARRRGMLGPGPVDVHLDHAEAMAAAVGGNFRGRFLDLGSGAGVPGVILVALWPAATGVLLEARKRRCSFLEAAVSELGLSDRASVACGRAEELARQPDFRGAFDLVVARGFGPPAATAECAVGFLGAGGRLAVSEPPGEADPKRWPAAGLAELGLLGPELRREEEAGIALFTAPEPAGERWPRRVGVPGRRPLW